MIELPINAMPLPRQGTLIYGCDLLTNTCEGQFKYINGNCVDRKAIRMKLCEKLNTLTENCKLLSRDFNF